MTHRNDGQLVVNQSWSRIFQDLILRGEIRRIGRSAFTAYVVIKGMIDFRSGTARISHERLGELIGADRKTAMRAVDVLKKHELIEVTAKHRAANEYKIIERLLVRSAGDGTLVGELCWTAPPEQQGTVDACIKAFKTTGAPPVFGRFSRVLRIVEVEETYELFHRPGDVDMPPLRDIDDQLG